MNISILQSPTVNVLDVSVDNSGGTSGNSEDRTEISLLMAF